MEVKAALGVRAFLVPVLTLGFALQAGGQEGITTIIGHNNEDMRIIDPSGRVVVYRIAEVPPLSRAHLPRFIATTVVPVEEEPADAESGKPRELIRLRRPVPPAPVEKAMDEAIDPDELAAKLHLAMDRVLVMQTIPRLPENSRRGVAPKLDDDARELNDEETALLKSLASDLRRQSRAQVPLNERRRGRVEQARVVEQGEFGEVEAETYDRVRWEYMARVNPQLPASVTKRTSRSSRQRVKSRFDPAATVLPIPEHLLYQPQPRFPERPAGKSFRIKVGDGFGRTRR